MREPLRRRCRRGRTVRRHWSYPEPNADVPDGNAVIHVGISRDGDGYLLDSPWLAGERVPYVVRDGRLVATRKGYPEMYVEGGQVMLSWAWGTSAAPVVLTPASGLPTRTPEAAAVIEGVHKIQVGVMSWALDHDMVYPARALVVAGTEFAARDVPQWPTDPYTGQPMKQGTGPGDFAYSAHGWSSFSLTAYGPNGQTLATVP